MPLPRGAVKGPRVTYRVIEGLVEVYRMSNNKVMGLLGLVRGGNTLTVAPPQVEPEKVEVPFLLQGFVPILTEAFGRANYSVRKYGEKIVGNEFTMTFQNKQIQEAFAKKFSKNPLISNPRLDFSESGFYISGRIGGIDMFARGAGGVSPSAGDTPFVNLKSVKMGPAYLPEHNLRSIESLFEKVYEHSTRFGIKLVRVTYFPQSVSLTFRKDAVRETDFPLHSTDLALPIDSSVTIDSLAASASAIPGDSPAIGDISVTSDTLVTSDTPVTNDVSATSDVPAASDTSATSVSSNV